MSTKKQPAKPKADEVKSEEIKPVSKASFSEELVKTLQEHSHINCAWVNEEGVWFFAEKPGFTAYSREEILNG